MTTTAPKPAYRAEKKSWDFISPRSHSSEGVHTSTHDFCRGYWLRYTVCPRHPRRDVPMQRWIVLTVAALCALVFVEPVSFSQPDDKETEEYWKTYELDGIPIKREELPVLPRPMPLFGRGGAFRNGESGYTIEPEILPESWHPGMGSRNHGWLENARDFANELDSVLGFGNQEVTGRDIGKPTVDAYGNAATHDRVAGIIQALQDWYAQRVAMSLFRLAEPYDGVTMDERATAVALKTATFVGNQQGEPGESLIWRDLAMQTLVTDYEMHLNHDGVGATLVHREFANGWEVVAGAFAVGEDQIMIQGYHAHSGVTGVREIEADLSNLKSPASTYGHHSAFAVVKEGEAIVLGGEYLLVPRVHDRFRSRTVDGLYVASPITSVRTSPLTVPAWPGNSDVVFGLPGADYEYNPRYELHYAISDVAYELAHDFSNAYRFVEHEPYALGPLVVIEPDEDNDKEVAAVEMKACRRLIEGGPHWFVHRVSLYELAADADMSEAPAKGTLLAGFDTASCAGQPVDWSDFEIENYLAGCYPLNASPRYIDPWICSAISGTKVRLKAEAVNDASRVELVAAYAPGYEIKQHKTLVGDITVNTESASIPTAHFRISADLTKDAESFATVPYPGDESKRLLLIIERVK